MKIEKYVKDKNNIYKVYIAGNVYKLYDDIIAKYQLLFKSELNEELLNEIIEDNNGLESYYLSIKFINKKLRSEKEIKDYLLKKEYSNKVIKDTIKKLKDNNFINDDIYLKAYVTDALNLTNNGPLKIRKELIKLGFTDESIDKYLDKINDDVWNEKLNNYIDKKIRLNHNNSSYMLKNKIIIELINLGYSKEIISGILNKKDINDLDAYKREYEKAKKSLESKYTGEELEYKIKEKLYHKGFKVNSYEE